MAISSILVGLCSTASLNCSMLQFSEEDAPTPRPRNLLMNGLEENPSETITCGFSEPLVEFGIDSYFNKLVSEKLIRDFVKSLSPNDISILYNCFRTDKIRLNLAHSDVLDKSFLDQIILQDDYLFLETFFNIKYVHVDFLVQLLVTSANNVCTKLITDQIISRIDDHSEALALASNYNLHDLVEALTI